MNPGTTCGVRLNWLDWRVLLQRKQVDTQKYSYEPPPPPAVPLAARKAMHQIARRHRHYARMHHRDLRFFHMPPCPPDFMSASSCCSIANPARFAVRRSVFVAVRSCCGRFHKRWLVNRGTCTAP